MKGFIKLIWRVGILYNMDFGKMILGYNVPWYEIESRGKWFIDKWRMGVVFNRFMGTGRVKRLVRFSITIQYYRGDLIIQCPGLVWLVKGCDWKARWQFYVREDPDNEDEDLVREKLAADMISLVAYRAAGWMWDNNRRNYA